MGDLKFVDNSFRVKAELNSTTIAWLHEWASETAAQAQRNCRTGEEYSTQLKGSYSSVVDEQKGEAQIGSPLEQAFWEEFGTGEYADQSKNGGKPGREGWWIYIPGQASMGGGNTYKTKEEAESMAAYIRAKYGKQAVVTNGKKPNYTLESAFTTTKPKAIEDLKDKLKERME